ncbi:MAG: 4'-phosphopantetheinyl transferase family protein [Myxococcota bacterium]
MVGNDVVDLDERSEPAGVDRERFDRRVFSEQERRAIARSDDPHRVRWSLWAAKEAAYKAAKRTDDAVVWSPIRFRVRLDPALGEGCVQHASGSFPVRLLPVKAGVHALAVALPLSDALASLGAPGAPIVFGCRRGPVDDPSAAVRQLAREQLALRLGVEAHELEVRRRGRIPELAWRGGAVDALLSLSHHGALVAHACLVAPAEALA